MTANLTERDPAQSCKNCNAAMKGRFCSQCGQKAVRERLNLKSILFDLPKNFFNLERGFFFTIYRCYLQVGQVAKDYCIGKRKIYVNPIAFFLLGATVQLIALTIVETRIYEEVLAQYESNPQIVDSIGNILGENSLPKVVRIYLNSVKAYSYLAFFGFAVPFAVSLWMLNKWITQRAINLAETMVFSLFCSGLIIFTTGIIAPLTMSVGLMTHGALGVVLFVAIPVFGALRFYEPSFKAAIMTVMAVVFSLLMFGLILLVTFGINLMIAVAQFKAANG